MLYNFVVDSFHTKKLRSRLSSSEVRFYTENGRFAFLNPPPLWGLGAMCDDHLRLIGKRVVDFLLVLIEHFSLGVIRLRCYKRISISLQRGPVDPKFQVEGVPPPDKPLFFSDFQKTRLNDRLYGIKIWTELSSVLSQCTRLTDGRTDKRQTAFSSLDRLAFNAAR